MPVKIDTDALIQRGLDNYTDVPKDELIGALMIAASASRSLADALSYSIVVISEVNAEEGKDLADFLMNKVLTEEAFAVIQSLADQARANL